jgi:Fe-Mn family superoxide dismutase
MKFVLPELPYAQNALEPYISAKTLSFHYGKHHKAYVDNLNGLVEGNDFANMPMEDIIAKADGKVFNNAAQAWNHTFYWYCMAAPSEGENMPTGEIAAALDDSFGGYDKFREQFTEVGKTHFGSGWAWLAATEGGKLEIIGMHDANTPVKDGHTPLLALDVWEHAYYLDYQNARPDYIEAFWKVVNWDFVAERLAGKDLGELMPKQ